jgi:antitoxin ParD1/3/4/toxin ParE1/3/4
MRRLFLTTDAERDLGKIWEYIAEDSLDAADRVRHEIQETIQQLLWMPGIGHRRVDVRDERYRFWKVYSYIIAYRYDEESLTVIRVVHGMRDFGALFG